MTWLISEDGTAAVCLQSGVVLRVVTTTTQRYDLAATSVHTDETNAITLRRFDSAGEAAKALRDIVEVSSAASRGERA